MHLLYLCVSTLNRIFVCNVFLPLFIIVLVCILEECGIKMLYVKCFGGIFYIYTFIIFVVIVECITYPMIPFEIFNYFNLVRTQR
jgi:hypothetical protein